jgi:hypothetical protein
MQVLGTYPQKIAFRIPRTLIASIAKPLKFKKSTPKGFENY